MANSRPKAPSRCWLAAILSAGVLAESNCDRACAISPNTVCSCFVIPLTVSTRFGIRSARRCSTTSTCDHADFTASFLLTSVLRTLTYLPNDSRAISSNVIITIRLLLMRSLLETKLSLPARCWRTWHFIHRRGHRLDGAQISASDIYCPELLAVRLLCPNVH